VEITVTGGVVGAQPAKKTATVKTGSTKRGWRMNSPAEALLHNSMSR
jgi:hypothetical protein